MNNQPVKVRKLKVDEYMQEYKISSRTTVYKRMENGWLEFEDLNKGKAKRRDIRIIVRDHEQMQVAA